MADLTVFFDGLCPLCRREMDALRALDKAQRIRFEDLNASDFSERFPYINIHKANRILHGESADGRVLLGLDVTCTAWALVGRGQWLAILRWPFIRLLADFGYRVFARYRYTISFLLTGERRCDICVRRS